MKFKNITLIKKVALVSKYHCIELDKVKNKTKIPLSRLLTIALDNELLKDKPFDLDFTFPDSIDFAYADEASKILDFLSVNKFGIGLDNLLLLRHDMGIHTREAFLGGFNECLSRNILDSYRPKDTVNIKYTKNYLHYKLFIKGSARERKMQRKSYSNYLKLHKKYAPGGSDDT